MRFRSLLFVPADSPRKFEKAALSGADALILDLEDSVVASKKEAARAYAATLMETAAPAVPPLFVRVNAIGGDLVLSDLNAVVRPGLRGVMLPKCEGAAHVLQLGHYLDAFEARADMQAGAVKILVVATETPAAMFALGSYWPAHPRLAGLTWGAEDLAAAIGATDNKEAHGGWSFPYRIARAQCLFAAAAAGVAPIDTLYAGYRDPAGLAADCEVARRDGFTGRIAIHPAQVPVINDCFTPNGGEVLLARRIVEAFAAQPEAGTLGIDGRMYDRPHLAAALKTLAWAGLS